MYYFRISAAVRQFQVRRRFPARPTHHLCRIFVYLSIYLSSPTVQSIFRRTLYYSLREYTLGIKKKMKIR